MRTTNSPSAHARASKFFRISRRNRPSLASLASLVLALTACDGGSTTPPTPDASTSDGLTYWADVAPLVRRECLGCHVEGGIGPFRLDSYEAIRDKADEVVEATGSGFMPPWMPDPSCREFEHQRGLTDDERAVFRRWRDTGMREGSPSDLPDGPEPPPPFTPTHVARMTEAYTPDPARPDDYRCFVLDYTPERDVFVRGRDIVPGASSLVHHVLAYGVPPSLLDSVYAADARDEGPGYQCFGGPLAPEGTEGNGNTLALIPLGGWVPGGLPIVMRDGRAIHLPAGSRIVMQVHYNLLENDPQPDQTEYRMILSETEPEFLVDTSPLPILDIAIPAGAPESTHRRVFRNYRRDPLTLTGLAPHMHLLGRRIQANVVPPMGVADAPACLVDIPRWDFNWQQAYGLRVDDTLTVPTGGGIELTCTYDNSVTNQPIINGMQVEPRDVRWGEGTLDEMCLMYISHEVPWNGPPAIGCAAASDCLASCDDDDSTCLLRCEELDGGCRTCALQSTLGCARERCLLSAYAPAATCLQSCILSYAVLGGSFERCLQTECPAEAGAVFECVAGVVNEGTCDEALAGCGIAR